MSIVELDKYTLDERFHPDYAYRDETLFVYYKWCFSCFGAPKFATEYPFTCPFSISSNTLVAGNDAEVKWKMFVKKVFMGTDDENKEFLYSFKLKFLQLDPNLSYSYEIKLHQDTERASFSSVEPKKDFRSESGLTARKTNEILLFTNTELATSEVFDYDKSVVLDLKIVFERRKEEPTIPEPETGASNLNIDYTKVTDEDFRDFEELLKNEFFADVTLVMGDKRIKAHRNILAARSPVLLGTLSSTNQHQHLEIEIKDVDYDVMQQVINFMYTGQIRDQGEDETIALLLAANKFAISSLYRKCEPLLCKYVKPENVVEMLKLADSCHAEKVVDSCIDILIDNIKVIDQKDVMSLKSSLVAKILFGVANKHVLE